MEGHVECAWLPGRVKPVLETARVAANEPVCPGTWRMVLEAPHTARHAVPGQFVHLGLDVERDSVLRVPISVHAAHRQEQEVELLYQVVGPSTTVMSEQIVPGDELDLIGPIGNGWSMPEGTGAGRALIVGGGLGAAPVASLAEAWAAAGVRTDAILGAQTSERILSRERFEAVCGTVAIATDDGTEGDHGFVTVPLERMVASALEAGDPYTYIAVCGPTPMMRNCVRLLPDGVRCEVSMERLMACGVGACLSCIVPLAAGGTKRACVDGPVFDAREVDWDAC